MSDDTRQDGERGVADYEPAVRGTDGAAEIPGLKPVKDGPVTVRVRFEGYRLKVDVRVDVRGPVKARDFPTLELYPDHLRDVGEISYGIAGRVRLQLTARPEPGDQRVEVLVDGTGVVGKIIGRREFDVPYGRFVFPDTTGFAHPKPIDAPTLQAAVDPGTWRRLPQADGGAPGLRSAPGDVEQVFTMLGGQDFIARARAHARDGLERVAGETGLQAGRFDPLLALGVSGEAAKVVAIGAGGGVYMTLDDIGVYGTASASVGFLLGLSADLDLALYWGLDGPGSALANFSGTGWFVEASAGVVLEGGGALSFSDECKPVGVTLSAGVGGDLSAGVGVAHTATHSFVRNGVDTTS